MSTTTPAPVAKKEPLQPYGALTEVPIACKYLAYVDNDRTCTDVCCIILGVIFFLGMLVPTFFLYNDSIYFVTAVNFQRSNFATDSDGNVCVSDVPAYPYIYFSDPANPVIYSLFRPEESA